MQTGHQPGRPPGADDARGVALSDPSRGRCKGPEQPRQAAECALRLPAQAVRVRGRVLRGVGARSSAPAALSFLLQSGCELKPLKTKDTPSLTADGPRARLPRAWAALTPGRSQRWNFLEGASYMWNVSAADWQTPCKARKSTVSAPRNTRTPTLHAHTLTRAHTRVNTLSDDTHAQTRTHTDVHTRAHSAPPHCMHTHS